MNPLALLKLVPPKVWGALALVLLLGGWGAWQWNAKRNAQLDLARCQVLVAEFEGAYNVLAAAVQEQARAIHKLEEEGRRRAKEGAAALAKAKAEGGTWRRSADRLRAILAAPMPLTCDEAVEEAKAEL